MPGDEVVLHWSVDDNQLIRASVELPGCGLHLHDHSFYADDLAHIDFGTDGRRFATEALLAVKLDLVALHSAALAVLGREISDLGQRLDGQQTRLENAWEAETFRSITEELRLIRQEISRLRHNPKARAVALEEAISDLDQRRRRAAAVLDAATSAEIEGHISTARNALDQQQFGICERAVAAGERVIARTVVALPGYFNALFMQLRGQRHASIDKARFDQLVALGDVALAAGQEDKVRQVVIDLDATLVKAGGATTDAAAQAGLRR